MNAKRIVVLGSTGMLGHVVTAQLQKFATVIPSVRNLDASARSAGAFYFDALLHNKCLDQTIPKCDVVINCIGTIPQRGIIPYDHMFETNCMLPIHLGDFSIKNSIPVIHVTTDCVFSGLTGMYHEDDIHDATDDYGKLKSAGESKNIMSLRTSIIGPESGTSYNLLEWTKTQAGKIVNGYENHIWNGLTTKELANVMWRIIDQGHYKNGVYHIFSSRPVTKYQMIRAINEKYKLKIDLQRHWTHIAVDRTLTSKYDLCDNLNIATFEDMLRDLDA